MMVDENFGFKILCLDDISHCLRLLLPQKKRKRLLTRYSSAGYLSNYLAKLAILHALAFPEGWFPCLLPPLAREWKTCDLTGFDGGVSLDRPEFQ